jgi:peptide/nickel transport system substrate-binding protein
MPRRTWMSLAMLATGAALLIAAQQAGAVADRRGGIFRVGNVGSSFPVDPQIAYINTAWWLEYATAAKLYNYPDKRGASGTALVPEVASGFTVSRGGRRYTFTIRRGFRFSDGTPVTADSFKYAIDRAANHDLASPAAQFITDPHGTDIVGARAVNSGHGTDVRGVRVAGDRLIIDLAHPDATFMSKITMPFFQATSTKLPIDREVVNVRGVEDLPSAGPYAFSRNEVNYRMSIRRNPYWSRGPGRRRPRNLDGLDIYWNVVEAYAYQQVNDGSLDLGPLPASEVQPVANAYGVNKTRFWTMPTNCVGYLPLNMANHLFKGNPKLRRAINYAIDRGAYIAQAGPYAGFRWTHLLTWNMLASNQPSPYPLAPKLARARQLAAGHMRDGKITVYYRSSGTTNQGQAEVVRQDLINLGFAPANITMKGFSGANIYDAMGKRGNDADIGVSMGFCTDYPDPGSLLTVVFGAGGYNYSQMYLPLWQKRIAAASRLVGRERALAFGKLDFDIMRKVAPVAVERTYNNRYFFSNRVDPKSLVYQRVYSDWSIPALALK